MIQLTQKPQAKQIETALASRQNDSVAKAWSMVLSFAVLTGPPSEAERKSFIDACNAALSRDLGHGYMYYFLGRAMLDRDAPDADVIERVAPAEPSDPEVRPPGWKLRFDCERRIRVGRRRLVKADEAAHQAGSKPGGGE